MKSCVLLPWVSPSAPPTAKGICPLRGLFLVTHYTSLSTHLSVLSTKKEAGKDARGPSQYSLRYGGGGGNRTRIQRLRPVESTRLVPSLVSRQP